MGKADISQLPLSDIGELCVHLSRGKSKIGKGPRDPSLVRVNKSTVGSVSRAEIGNMLDEFKTNILWSLGEQIDTLKLQNKQKDEADYLAIFCPKCRKKHALREFPLDAKIIETCVICLENHETKSCTSIPSLKDVFQEETISNQHNLFALSLEDLGRGNKTRVLTTKCLCSPLQVVILGSNLGLNLNLKLNLGLKECKILMEYSLHTINILHHIQTILPNKFLNKINNPNFKTKTLNIHYHFHKDQISYRPNHLQTPTIKIIRIPIWRKFNNFQLI